MGKKKTGVTVQQNRGKKPINPLIVFLAFFLGAAVAVFVVFWRLRASKDKKDEKDEKSDGASDRTVPHVDVQKVKPYRPRKRMSAKRIFGRAVAVAAAAGLVVTGLYVEPSGSANMPVVQAKESFGGIKQVVQEHGKENPFVILNIVPQKAVSKDGGYEISLGTIGYLAPGQSPIQQDLARIFTGDNKTSLYPYSERKKLTDSIIGIGGDLFEIAYKEAYLGIDGTEQELANSGWTRIFDQVAEPEEDGNGELPANSYPTGRLWANVVVEEGQGDYELVGPNDGSFSTASLMSSSLQDGGIYKFKENSEEGYHVIFRRPENAASGYQAEVQEAGSIAELIGSYSEATGVYQFENGVYVYRGTIGELKSKENSGSETSDPITDTDTTTTTDPDTTTDTNTNTNTDTTTDTTTDPTTDPPADTPEDPPADPPADTPTDPPTIPETPAASDAGTPADPPAIPETPAASDAGTTTASASQTERHGAGWYLCAGVEEPEPPASADEGSVPEPPASADEGSVPETPVTPNPESVNNVPEGTYCVLAFTYVENVEEQILYQDIEINPITGELCPFDSYVRESGQLLNSLASVETYAAASVDEPVAYFEYVGPGQGDYKITRGSGPETAAAAADSDLTDDKDPETDEESDEENREAIELAADRVASYIEVRNAPVYMQCSSTVTKNNWLQEYVFHSLHMQDNASDDFTIQVKTMCAAEVQYSDIEEADLVYLEDGEGLVLADESGWTKKYIKPAEWSGNSSETETDDEEGDSSETGDVEGLGDISDEVITRLLYRAVQESMPVIVDYPIMDNPDFPNGYGGSNYQKLARTFLKKDLTAFYNYNMSESGNLAANILMNADKDKDFPNKTENDYHYVNRNVYIAGGKNGTRLVAEDFYVPMEKNAVTAGFSEVLAAIRMENVLLSDDEKISEDISKAMAVQYIINYSLGLIGEYKDLSILELQPTANKSDLYWDSDEEKNRVVFFWQRDGQKEKGQQILRSSKLINIDVTTSSVAAFNSNNQDINTAYNMIFIGLDGQRLYRDRDEGGLLSTLYNDNSLNGTVYHTGDRVAGGDARYDASDITEQKKEALIDYLKAGYPIVVENDCFTEKTARKAEEKDINTKYIHRDTQMYAFLAEAIAMGRSDQNEETGESGIGLYTIEDVHSSAAFTMQLNAQRPKIELWEEVENTEENGGDDSENKQILSDMIETVSVPEEPGVSRGTIGYRITSDRPGEDKAYKGNLDRHLYLDLNYDGVFAEEEEVTEYEYEEYEGIGRISVDFNEINFGVVPWKLEVTDADYPSRRAAVEGCFTIKGDGKEKIRVLQVLDDTKNMAANLEEQYDQYETKEKVKYTLAQSLKGAEARLGIEWKIETVTSDTLERRIDKNDNYLSRWDVVVLGFGESVNPGNTVTAAVKKFAALGGSVVISSAGASADRLGLWSDNPEPGQKMDLDLGQKGSLTYGKLGLLYAGSQYRYNGINADMFNAKSGLFVDRINDGAITKWPYQIDMRVQLGSATEVSMPDYLLDIGTVKEAGQPYTTAWFTLLDADTSSDGSNTGGYSVSPRDGRNNYYLYSKGNVVYVGQSQYPYTYDAGSEKEQEEGISKGPEEEGLGECRIFVNALVAAYNGGVHRADVSIVAGFNGVAKVESVTVPYDVAFTLTDDDNAKRGILGDTVDVFFRFTDNNIAIDKTTKLAFYYMKPDRNSGEGANTELLQTENGIESINTNDFEPFESPIWTVEDNRLVEVTEDIVPGKVYRIKAPLVTLQQGNDVASQICVLVTNQYTRAGQSVEALSFDSVSLNRAQMFLLE